MAEKGVEEQVLAMERLRLFVYFSLLFSVFKISGIIRVSRMDINVPTGIMTLMKLIYKW